jgi:hypothetical protein
MPKTLFIIRSDGQNQLTIEPKHVKLGVAIGYIVHKQLHK